MAATGRLQVRRRPQKPPIARIKEQGRSVSRKFLATWLVVLAAISATAQEIDTTLVKRLIRYEATIDSLQKLVFYLNGEIQYLKKTMAEEDEQFFQLVQLLTGAEDVEAPQDRLSRRKRVDALLRVINQRPGQVRFNGDATAIVQASVKGKPNIRVATGSMDLLAHTNFGDNVILFVDLEAIGGNGPLPYTHSVTNLNADAGSTQSPDGIDRLNVLEAWTDFTILGGILQATAGKIDLTNYFDNNAFANDETMQFITDAFVNGAAFAVPSNSPGLRVRTTLFGRFSVRAALAKTENTGVDITRGLYRIGELGIRFSPTPTGRETFGCSATSTPRFAIARALD